MLDEDARSVLAPEAPRPSTRRRLHEEGGLTDPLSVVSQEDFRRTLGSVCAPVTIVTAFGPNGPHGTTVSAFSSLSLDPPMIMVALDRGSDLLAILRESGQFGVNLLSHLQDELALWFARKGSDKFHGIHWRSEHGVPRLIDVSGWLACELRELLEGGDHVIAIGLVMASQPTDGAPLVYHNQQFGTHSHFVDTDSTGRGLA
jgi:flavin reductase (DIM6/NTAB) family NADH-FMN oxidoreductase RutF